MRMRIRASVVVLLSLWLALAAAAQSAASQPQAQVEAVGAISMTVSNLEHSVEFYSRVLSFQKAAEYRSASDNGDLNSTEMQLGHERIELVQSRSSNGRPIPPDSRSNDRWFQHIAIIVSDMDRAYAVLQADHVRGVSHGPQRLPEWNKNAAGIRAYYFLDPDGHPLEILQFPPSKGAAKWHRSDRLFLGIDHTAIVVTDTEASLHFYRDLLGLRIAGTSENYGPEQERLNNVPGAHLRITTLRAASGPGIELLEYVQPRGGRDLPYHPALSELVHRHTTVFAKDLKAIAHAVEGGTASPMLHYVNVAGKPAAFFVRDPDGHELLIRGR